MLRNEDKKGKLDKQKTQMCRQNIIQKHDFLISCFFVCVISRCTWKVYILNW